MEIYLDNHATTRCDPDVLAEMLPWFSDDFGNAASGSHRWGRRARTAVENARVRLANRLGCSPKELVFTSGATEANNLAVLGTMRANRDRGDHLIVGATEHKAVLDAARAWEREGGSLTILPVDATGQVDPQRLADALTDRTVLVSLMSANNEIGTLHPIAELAAVCAQRGVRFHTDAAQTLSSAAFDLRGATVDLLSLTAHKAYGPKGIGLLYVRRQHPALVLEPLQYGGGHERGHRSGTLPVPLIVGLGAAAERFDPAEVDRIRRQRDQLLGALLALGGVTLNGHPTERLPGNLNVCIDGVESKALITALPDIAMSSGSACSTASLTPSHVLTAIGLDTDNARSSLRLGVGRFNTDAQIAYAIDALTDKIGVIRALTAAYPT